MKRRLTALLLVLMLVLTSGVVFAKKPAIPPEPNPELGQKIGPATPNLSFPVIATDVIEIFYQKIFVDDLDGEYEDSDWQLGYDSDGDGVVDNTSGVGVLVPIQVTESITDTYDGTYPGNDTFFYQTYVVVDGNTVDLLTQTWEDIDGDLYFELEEWVSYDGSDGLPDKTEPIPMLEWLPDMGPWYDQPLTIAYPNDYEDPNLIWNATYVDTTDGGGANSWQAEWITTDQAIQVDVIDWGNPLENNNPIVGQRFPVEIALYEKLADPMLAYKMACLEYPSTRVELFGTSKMGSETFTKEIYFATVLTNKFFAEVWNPDGTITKIPIEPGIGPSGKMNFASAGGGWTPTMPGVHRIWLHFNDPLISFSGAVINDDEHYIMSSGVEAEPLNKNKAEMSGIVGDSTFIEVLVVKPAGKPRK